MSATTVVPLSASVAVTCPVCDNPATWQIGPTERACDTHLPEQITAAYRALNEPATGWWPR